MEQTVSYIILNNSIVFNFDKKTFTVKKGTPEHDACVLALKEDRKADIPAIINKVGGINKAMQEAGASFEVRDGHMYCDGELVHNYVADRIVEFYNARLPFMPLVNFWRRLRHNPSTNSVQQLYKFLEVCKCPITEDGLFVSVKGVYATDDPDVFYSGHDYSFKYTLGKYSEMPRSEVEDDPHRACGKGLHAGSFKYASGWAPIVIELLIDPADVVSVPNDHNHEKLRACRVLPIAVHMGEQYKKGIVVVATKEEEASIVTGARLSITGVTYATEEVTDEAFRNVTDIDKVTAFSNVSSVLRYRASKAPAAIRAVYNKPHLPLREAFKFSFSGCNDVMFLVRQEDASENSVYTLVYPEYFDPKEFIAHVVKVHESEKTSVFTQTASVVANVTFGSEPYEVVAIDIAPESVLKEFVEKNAIGANIEGFTRIKPSKAPVGLRNVFEIAEFYRIGFVGGTVAFVFEGHSSRMCGKKYFIMRRVS